MASCTSIPVSTLFSTDIETLTTSTLTTTLTNVTSAGPVTNTITTSACATTTSVDETCSSFTPTTILTTTPGFEWTSTTTTTIYGTSLSTSFIPTSTVFTTSCSSGGTTSSVSSSQSSQSSSQSTPPPSSGSGGSSSNNGGGGGSSSNTSPANDNTSGDNTSGTTTAGSYSTFSTQTTLPNGQTSGIFGSVSVSASASGSPQLNGSQSGGDGSSSNSTGKTVGIVLGTVLGAALLGSLIFFFWRKRVQHWDDIFEDSDDEDAGRAGRAGRGWMAAGGAHMLRNRRKSKRRPVDLDPGPNPYEYGLVGTDRTLTTPTAASGLVAAAAPSGYHQRTVSSYSLPDTPTSMGPVVRPTSAMALAHTRVPSSPNGSFSLPPNAAMPLVDVSSSHNGGVSPASPAISTHRRSGSGSPVSMDFGAIGARPPSVLSHATSATSDTVAPSLLSPMSRDYGALGIRPMSTSTVATSTTTRADRPASHQRGSSFGSSALAAVDSVVAGRVSGQVAPLPPSPRTLKSSEASSTARSPTTPVIVHQDAGPAASAAEPPAYSR